MRELKIKPEIGKLYKFREDNREALLKKYSHHYTGLLLCIQTDIINDISVPESVKNWVQHPNPIYQFEVYNCVQIFAQIDFFGRKEIIIKSPLYLTLFELNDMIEDAYGKKET
jgi:hypothetical protein